MVRDTSDVSTWAAVRYSETEIPLLDIVADIRADPKSFSLHRSKQYPSSWLMWDNLSDQVVVATHAFVIRYSSPLETGNFVPDGKTVPEGLVEYLRKSEPSSMAQVSLTFDSRMDDNLQPALTYLEEWAMKVPGFTPGTRRRNPWMSPEYVGSQMKYTVTSHLFQTKTAFNCKENGYSVDYPVHPWIEAACYPHNPSWIPNPHRVQFFDGVGGKLTDIRDSHDRQFNPGDIVKMTFKISFTIGREMWNMSFIPIQAIRVGQVDKSSLSPSQLEDHKPLMLPKRGQKLEEITNPVNRREKKIFKVSLKINQEPITEQIVVSDAEEGSEGDASLTASSNGGDNPGNVGSEADKGNEESEVGDEPLTDKDWDLESKISNMKRRLEEETARKPRTVRQRTLKLH